MSVKQQPIINFIDKYIPKSIEDIIGNTDEIAEISKWLSIFNNPSLADKDFKNAILISGPIGVGKTCSTHVLLKKYGYDIIEFNASEIKTSDEICEKLDNILSGNSINMMLQSTNKTSVIMDEIDGIETKKEYSASDMLDYINYNENQYNKLIKSKNDKAKKKESVIAKQQKQIDTLYKRCFNNIWVNKNPIIFICNVINKNITPIIKSVNHIRFNAPTDLNIYTLIKRINTNECLGLNDVILNIIVTKCQSDYRRSIYLMQQIAIHVLFANTNASNLEIINMVNNLGSKDIDIELYTAIDNIFTVKDMTIDVAITNYDVDQNFVPFIIHENFIPFIDKNVVGTYKDKLDIGLQYYDGLLDAQVFKNQLFGNWDMSDYVGFFSCAVVNNILKKAKLRSPLTYMKYEKSALISKYNYRYYNLKSINSISKKLNIDIYNFPVISAFIVYSIFTDPAYLDKTIEYYANKNLTFKEFEKTMKLSIAYDKYEKRYTKKFQKQLSTKYSLYNNVIDMDEDS